MSRRFPKYASVVVDLAVGKMLDYGIPEPLVAEAAPGVRVAVPLRGREREGYIFCIKERPGFEPVQPVAKILSHGGLIGKELFELALWMAGYYCAPLNAVFRAMLPASVRRVSKDKTQLYVMRAKTRAALQEYCAKIRGKNAAQTAILDEMLKVKKGILLTELLERSGGSKSPVETLAKKGFLKLDIVRVDRSPLIEEEYFRTKPKRLNPEQKEALEKIHSTLDEKRFEAHLLHGVTGSGKTEVYLQALERAIAQDKGAIVLVPEISLTPQTIERFKSRFDRPIAVLHHRLSDGERRDAWHNIQSGNMKIVIGARSAIFSPVQDLGLIIVDEEHEPSYKQSEESPCYHARDIAVMRGKQHGAAVILGSATPSLESYYNAKKGKYRLSHLPSRAGGAEGMPSVKIVDMKHEFEKAKGYTSFADALLTGMKKRAERGEQTILFLNRRGYHTALTCSACGEAVRCPHCDIALTFYKGKNSLACHHCGYALAPPPKRCPKCGGEAEMKFRGVGTEQIERALHALLPDLRTLRVDADTTRHKGSHQKLLRAFGTGKADVLIGTQMIAKGLHFPQVTLVGILNSDAALNIPDYRASETVFQLITQVSGRAGRGAAKGEVIIQTQMPDNETIRLAAAQDYMGFFETELASRKMFGFPPIFSMAKILFSSKIEERALAEAKKAAAALRQMLPQEYEIHPPLPAGHAKIKDRFRYQFLICGPAATPLSKAIEHYRTHCPLPKEMGRLININPLSSFF